MTIERNNARIAATMERHERRLHDEAFGPKKVECDWCEYEFLDDDGFSSELDDAYYFCSTNCVNEFNNENKHDYEE